MAAGAEARKRLGVEMSSTDELLQNAARYAEAFDKGSLPAEPAKKVAVVTCMDARLLPARILGLREGDAHVIRNAGGIVTADTLRSLAISQRVLGTEEVVVIQHTGCGMLGFDDGRFREQLENETGTPPEWSAELSGDLQHNVREAVAQVRTSPFLAGTVSVRGFVYEVETGRLREVV